MMKMFLERDEIATLTGRKSKSKQIEALRHMGVPFRVNALGEPVVAVSAIDGGKAEQAPTAGVWVPRVLRVH